MYLIRFSLCAATLAFSLAACSDLVDLEPVGPAIEVVPYTAEMTYLSSNPTTRTIELGEVAVYGSGTAVFAIRNTTTHELRVLSIDYVDTETLGETWGTPTWRRDMDDSTSSAAPFTVPSLSTRLIQIPFAPRDEGQAKAKLIITSTALNARQIPIHVEANGKYHGQPDIEVAYNGMDGPTVPSDCENGVCTMATPLDFGNVGMGTEATARITLRNTATCPPFPGADSCMSCSLRIDEDSTAQNIGLGFKMGTNDEGRFQFAGSSATPFSIPQADVDCGNSGEIKLLVTFSAPESESYFETVIVIESNDPDEPVIEIPVRATSKDAPIAIGDIRECGTVNPQGTTNLTDCSYADSINPLGRVHLEGGNSYDPNGGQIVQYRWELLDSPVANQDNYDFDWVGQDTATPSLYVPLAGDYVIQLIVWNQDNVTSSFTVESTVTFHAKPESLLHVQLTWDNPLNDQDLHLTHASAGGHFCSSQFDTYYMNKQPLWFNTDVAGKGPNPRLDIDDTAGLGPENINIDEPEPGAYRVFVHYYPSAIAPTQNTVRIYTNGVLDFVAQRVLTGVHQVWAVATVNWVDDGSEYGVGSVEPFPNPSGDGQSGSVAVLDEASCGTPTGWVFPGE